MPRTLDTWVNACYELLNPGLVSGDKELAWLPWPSIRGAPLAPFVLIKSWDAPSLPVALAGQTPRL
jgi:hypothetical protein